MPRVLIADDSPTSRALLQDVLGSDPEIEIVGEARNGAEALALTVQLQPDVITMDVEMPGMNGYDATKEIMIHQPTPVIILSTYVEDDIDQCAEAFRAGALATFHKLPGVDAPDFEQRVWELSHTVKQLAHVRVARHYRIAAQPDAKPQDLPPDDRLRAIVTSVSAPGAAALSRLLAKLPPRFAIPIVVVPHVGSGMAERMVPSLARNTRLNVRLPKHGEPLEAGSVYIAPDHHHLTLAGEYRSCWIELSSTEPVRGYRPSASLLFDSAATVFGHTALALVLKGVGEDGIPGLCSIRLAGGRIVAHEEAQRTGFHSASADVAYGLADLTLPLDVIAGQLLGAHAQVADRPRHAVGPLAVARAAHG